MRENETSRDSRSSRECRRLAHLLSALPDGELTASQRALLQAHMDACTSCAKEAQELTRVGELLRGHPAPAPSLPSGAEAVAQILARENDARAVDGALRSRARCAVRSARSRRLLPIAAAVLTLAVVFVLTRPPRLQPSPVIPASRRMPDSGARAALLLVVDDERTGRRVLIAPPSVGAGEGRDGRAP